MLDIGQADGRADAREPTFVLRGGGKAIPPKRHVKDKRGWWQGMLENSVWWDGTAQKQALWALGPLIYMQLPKSITSFCLCRWAVVNRS